MNGEQIAKAALLAVVVALAWLQIWLFLSSPYLNQDVALILSAGARLAEGGRPYVDVIDTNPLAAFYLSAVPAWVSAVTGIPLAGVGLFFWAVLVVASTVFILWLARRVLPDRSSLHIFFLASVLITANIQVYAIREFAQRDHLIILWLIAFALVRYARYEKLAVPAAACMLAGVAAGLGLAMKPQYAVIPLFAEIVLVYWYRKPCLRVRHQELSAAVLLGAFLFLLLFLTGAWDGFIYWSKKIMTGHSAYSIGTLPLILRKVFSDRVDLISLIIILILFSLTLLGRGSSIFRSAALFGVLGLGCFVVMLVQHKGWEYHLVPYRLCALVGFGFLVSDIGVAFRLRAWPAIMVVVAVLLVPFSVAGRDISWMTHGISSGRAQPFPYDEFSDIMERLTRRGERVMFISSNVYPAFPSITYAGRRLAGRLTFAFPIAYMYANTEGYRLPPRWEGFESDFLRLLVEDIRKEKPALLFVSIDSASQALPSGFVIKEYLHRRGFDDSLRSSYVPIGSHFNFEVWAPSSSDSSTGQPGASPALHEAIEYLIEHSLLSPPK